MAWADMAVDQNSEIELDSDNSISIHATDFQLHLAVITGAVCTQNQYLKGAHFWPTGWIQIAEDFRSNLFEIALTKNQK